MVDFVFNIRNELGNCVANLIQKCQPVIPDNQLAGVIQSKSMRGLVAEPSAGDVGA